MIDRVAPFVLVVAAVACGPSVGNGDGGGDAGSTSGVDTTAGDPTATLDGGADTTPDDGVHTTPVDGGDDQCTDCCPPLPDGDELCAAVTDRDSCASVDVGDDFCVWIDWYPVKIGDVPACSIVGDPRGECRRQTCQSEGCYSGDSCGGRFADIVVVAAGPEWREIGIGPWCIPEGDLCHFVDGVADVDSPFECACACSPIVSCSGPLEPYVDAWVSSSSVPPDDCGSVTLDDPLDAWVAARECALARAGEGTPFTLVVDQPGVDSTPRQAWAARADAGFEIIGYVSDDFGGDFTLSRRTCSALAPLAGCEPAVGEPCLECLDAGKSESVCS